MRPGGWGGLSRRPDGPPAGRKHVLGGQTVDLIERGCRGYIQKPFSIRQLKEKIAEIFPGD
jgi:hypothetical protein